MSKKYENDESFIRSFGKCEICGKTTSCNDIYHAHLKLKRKKKR